MALEIGNVLYLFNKQIIPSNYKYSVCVVVDDNLFFCINSLNRKLYECMPLAKKKNNYLEHDSFVSCNRVFHFEPNEIKNAKVVGNLDYEDLLSLRNHIRDNVKTLSKKEKDRIVESLTTELENYE